MKMLGFFKRRNADCDKNGIFTHASRSPLRDRQKSVRVIREQVWNILVDLQKEMHTSGKKEPTTGQR